MFRIYNLLLLSIAAMCRLADDLCGVDAMAAVALAGHSRCLFNVVPMFPHFAHNYVIVAIVELYIIGQSNVSPLTNAGYKNVERYAIECMV